MTCLYGRYIVRVKIYAKQLQPVFYTFNEASEAKMKISYALCQMHDVP
jgi:hypothetical protein